MTSGRPLLIGPGAGVAGGRAEGGGQCSAGHTPTHPFSHWPPAPTFSCLLPVAPCPPLPACRLGSRTWGGVWAGLEVELQDTGAGLWGLAFGGLVIGARDRCGGIELQGGLSRLTPGGRGPQGGSGHCPLRVPSGRGWFGQGVLWLWVQVQAITCHPPHLDTRRARCGAGLRNRAWDRGRGQVVLRALAAASPEPAQQDCRPDRSPPRPLPCPGDPHLRRAVCGTSRHRQGRGDGRGNPAWELLSGVSRPICQPGEHGGGGGSTGRGAVPCEHECSGVPQGPPGRLSLPQWRQEPRRGLRTCAGAGNRPHPTSQVCALVLHDWVLAWGLAVGREEGRPWGVQTGLTLCPWADELSAP